MEGIIGNNHFDGQFDFFEWSAPYFMTPKEVIRELESIDYKGKKVKSINIIGFVDNIGRNNNGLLYWTIKNAGIEMKDGWMNSYPNINQVMLPWEAEACEPIQFVFEDETTLEIMPIGDGGARIGVNTIPANLSEGLNHSNFDANCFFAEALGRELHSIEMRVEKTVKQYINKYTEDCEKPYEETRTKYRFCLDFEFPIKMELVQSWESWYWIKMEGTGFDNKVPYSRIVSSIKQVEQVCIISGRDGGGVFWIVPICRNRDEEEKHFFIDNYGIAIDDGDVSQYLSEFLYKFFDPSIQEDEYSHFQGEPSFDWYGGNLYTFESVQAILDNISDTITLLEKDYNNPALTKIKSHYPWYRYTSKNKDELSENEINDLRQLGVPVVIDFYRRFIKRMEAMMRLPGRDTMSFAGP